MKSALSGFKKISKPEYMVEYMVNKGAIRKDLLPDETYRVAS